MARHRRGYFPSACAKKLLALRLGRQGDKRLRKRGPLLSFSPKEPQRKLDGSRNVSLTECRFFRWRSSAPSGKNPVEPCHAAFGGLLSAKLSRQTKTRGVPCRVAHSRHGIPLGSCLAKRPSLHFSRDVDARWAGAHVRSRQNAAFWLGWTYESVACPPVFIALVPEMEA